MNLSHRDGERMLGIRLRNLRQEFHTGFVITPVGLRERVLCLDKRYREFQAGIVSVDVLSTVNVTRAIASR